MPKHKIAIGLICGAFGLYIVLIGFNVLPVPGGRDRLHAPLWVAICAGLIFFLAGLTAFIQGIGRANANGELPADAPAWMAMLQYGSVPAIWACFAVIGTWIAFGPGEHAFTRTGSYETLGRIAFGIGAVIVWLCALAFAVGALRRYRHWRQG
ncbi:MAG: hypothetical protein K9G60_05970 [Pseudolabrys sp.]|nr:hypothetical protein [Pseudolabrys sp.]